MLFYIYTLIFLSQISREISFDLHGSTVLGYYYVEGFFGEPPQKQSLIIDTGSHYLITLCDGCKNCGKRHQNRFFDPSKSSSFHKLDSKDEVLNWNCAMLGRKDCSFETNYSEGSKYTGFLAVDNFKFKSEADSHFPKKMIFGCALRETGLFKTQKADGIIGFGIPSKKAYYFHPPTILEDENSRPSVFSICIGKNGGRISLGDWNKDLHRKNGKALWMKNSGSPWRVQYKILLKKVKLEGNLVSETIENFLDIDEDPKDINNIFLDSGSTITYFNEKLFYELQEAFD